MEWLVVILAGAVIVALGIALAPYVLPAVGVISVLIAIAAVGALVSSVLDSGRQDRTASTDEAGPDQRRRRILALVIFAVLVLMLSTVK